MEGGGQPNRLTPPAQLLQEAATLYPSRDKEGQSICVRSLHSIWSLKWNLHLFQQILRVCKIYLFLHPLLAQKEGGIAALLSTQSVSEKRESSSEPSNRFLFWDGDCHKRGTHPLPCIQLTLCETGRGLRRFSGPIQNLPRGAFSEDSSEQRLPN